MSATGAEPIHVRVRAVLAEVESALIKPEEGLRIVGETLAESDRSAGNYELAENYRIMGVLKLKTGTPQMQKAIQREAEEGFFRAIEISRRQKAKSFELRAAMDLSRLWQQQGKRKQALQALTKTYSWFTEGFNTGDLEEAKSLIEELH